jgi:glycosyltransferase involved in cell wall biosynthesis
MIGPHRATVVIPALNEEDGVVATIARAPRGVDQIVVIDGGSSDATKTNAHSAGATVIEQLVRGYGLAYKTGFNAATGDIIITGDADGTYPIELAPEIIEEMDRRGLDFVSCTRFPLADRESMERLNRFGNRALTLLGSVVALHHFHDLLSGMWILRKSVLPELRLATNGWNFSAEIKLEAAYKLRRRFTEVHIPYRDRVGMTHNVRPFRIGAENALFIMYKRVSQLYRARLMRSSEDQIRARRREPQ